MSRKIFVAIIAEDKESEILKFFSNEGINPICISGRGMACVMNFGNLFNLSCDRRTTVIASVTETEAVKFLQYFTDVYNFDAPGEGIAFYLNADGYIG